MRTLPRRGPTVALLGDFASARTEWTMVGLVRSRSRHGRNPHV
jgi:hypothetical protein